jgi:hypothetical protein
VTDSSPLPDRTLEGAPASIADLSAAACEYVVRAVGVSVDYTPETLPIVDHYVTLVRSEVEGRPELLLLVARALGAYFGRVVLGQLEGFWRVTSDDDHGWLVCLKGVLLAFNPVGIAYDVLRQGQSGGPSSEIHLTREERRVVAARLEALPSVDEAEYFMLATRLEGIEIAAAALRELGAEGTADVEFEWEDYDGVVVSS